MDKHTFALTTAKTLINASLLTGLAIALLGLTSSFWVLALTQLVALALLIELKVSRENRDIDLYGLTKEVATVFLAFLNILAGNVFESQLTVPCFGLALVGMSLKCIVWIYELKRQDQHLNAHHN